MLQLDKQPGMRVLELGCGENRHPQADVAVDVRKTNATDFACNLSVFPWPLQDAEFDFVLAWAAPPSLAGDLARCAEPVFAQGRLSIFRHRSARPGARRSELGRQDR